MLKVIAGVLGHVLNWIYENISFHNYGLAIIVFTVMMRLILLPLAIKQSRVSQKIKVIQPKIDELKKQGKSAEMAKVYEEEGINPASGCLVPLLPFPIMCSLFYVVSRPLTYMKGMSAQEVARLVSLVPPEKRIAGVYEQIAAVVHNNLLNMNFLGIDLASIPELKFNSLLVLPVLAAVTTYLSIKFGVKSTTGDGEQNRKTGFVTSIFIPMLTFWFALKAPASMCVYWVTSSLIQILQQWFLNSSYVVSP